MTYTRVEISNIKVLYIDRFVLIFLIEVRLKIIKKFFLIKKMIERSYPCWKFYRTYVG